jgi:hypothetical protein
LGNRISPSGTARAQHKPNVTANAPRRRLRQRRQRRRRQDKWLVDYPATDDESRSSTPDSPRRPTHPDARLTSSWGRHQAPEPVEARHQIPTLAAHRSFTIIAPGTFACPHHLGPALSPRRHATGIPAASWPSLVSQSTAYGVLCLIQRARGVAISRRPQGPAFLPLSSPPRKATLGHTVRGERQPCP